MLEISVVICTHNPRPPYLARVLDALCNQSLPLSAWELLLVDNSSTRQLAHDWDISWHPQARHVREEKLGLAHARQRGITESKAQVIVFVDDDNVLDRNYLENVARISQEWPLLGVWGCGSSIPEFEMEPREELSEYIFFLAAFEGRELKWSNSITCKEATPVGVGLCIRSSVAKAYLDSWNANSTQILDRNGTSLLSGGDYDIAYTACKLGLGMGVFPELKVKHLIPKERVTAEYLVRLNEGIATSIHLLNYKWLKLLPKNYRTPKGLVAVIAKSVLLRGIKRRMYLAEVRASINARRMISGG